MNIIIELKSNGEKIRGVLTGPSDMINELLETVDKMDWGSTVWVLNSESPLNDVAVRINA